jgi:hypothetical protein
MCKINCEIEEGLIPLEKIARIKCADGSIEEVSVPSQQVTGSRLHASEVGRDQGMVLVELPREAASGRWRVWVSVDSLTGG